jgi:D-alanyl-D-alanine-carboxypeptidase/D-alanyl-D-alanine-endopeptidase
MAGALRQTSNARMRVTEQAGNPLRPALRAGFLGGLALLLMGSLAAQDNRVAQDNSDIVGSYSGEIGAKPATLHIRIRPDGSLTATLDNLDLRAPWMFTCADLHREGSTLTFTVPSIQASFRGSFAAGATELKGAWTHSSGSMLVTFTRQNFVPAPRPSALDGIWLGTQPIGDDPSSRVQIVFRSDADGREYCTADALDIYYMDLECANVVFKDDRVSFDIPAVGEHWSGKIRADGNALLGEIHAKLIQGSSTKDVSEPLNLARQKVLSLERPRPGPSYDAALPPVAAADLESVLANDLAVTLKKGELAPGTGGGVSIGVYAHGVRQVFCFGTAKPDSIFEIGSITRPFTGLLLAQMAAQHKVQLDEPVRELLPEGSVARPQGGEITLLDLASQQSGLPAMPDNISLANLDQPYAGYRFSDLLAYLSKHGVANPSRTPSSFSTLGFGLLGEALATRAGVPYGQLIQDEIDAPLGMSDTVVTLSSQQQARLLPGHDEFHGPAHAWNSDALAPAIGLRSTAQDMLTFLVANLHPEQIKPGSNDPAAASFPAAVRESLQIRGKLSPGIDIAIGWLYQAETGNYWHSGATAAYSAYAFMNPKGDFAAVLLLNGSPGVNGSFVENLGRHVYQRLAGKPALSLNP